MYALGAYVTAILAVRGVTSEIVPLLLIGGAAAMAAGALVAFQQGQLMATLTLAPAA